MQIDEGHVYLADRLAGRLADRLSEAVQAHIRAHLLSCADCCEHLEDFEELQTALRTIPMETCDSAAMRARFDSVMKPSGPPGVSTEVLTPVRTGARTWRLQFLLALLVLALTLYAARQTGRWAAVQTTPIPKPAALPELPGVVTGQVRTVDGAVSSGVRVAVMAVSESGSTPAPERIRVGQTNDEGRYRLENIPAGRYYVIAGSVDVPTYFPGTPNAADATIVSIKSGAVIEYIDFARFAPARTLPEPTKATVVNTGSVSGLQSTIPIANVTGQLLLETGAEIQDAESLGEIVVSAASDLNNVSTTVVKFDSRGRFAHGLGFGEYRFRFGVLSEEYVVRSMTSGTADLMKDTLKVRGDAPVSVEIRLVRRTETGVAMIRGKVLDGLSNAPPPAGRLALCCFAFGPAERISTVIHPDGTFAFSTVPPGHYTAELPGKTSLVVSNPGIDVTNAGVEGLKLFSAPGMVPISVTVALDTHERLPYMPDASIVFSGASGNFRVAASPVIGNTFQAYLPANDVYTVTVSNIAEGYAVHSITDAGNVDLLHGGRIVALSSSVVSSLRVEITLTKVN